MGAPRRRRLKPIDDFCINTEHRLTRIELFICLLLVLNADRLPGLLDILKNLF